MVLRDVTTGAIGGKHDKLREEEVMSEKEAVRQGLVAAVIEASVADTWVDAVIEWDVDGVEEDDSARYSCLCGQQGLRYIYRIANVENGNRLVPIGSECIRKFGRPVMVTAAKRLRLLVEMRRLVRSGRPLDLKRDLTRARLAALHDGGAFGPSEWNGGNGSSDYRFLLEMFNRRREPSERQGWKIAALLREVSAFLRTPDTEDLEGVA